MSRPIATITIPTSRHDQLRALAAHHSTTIVELIESFLLSAIKRGELPDELPGFTATAAGDAVTVTLDGYQLPPLQPDEARIVAGLIKNASNLPPLSLPGGVRLFARRVGRGVALAVLDPSGQPAVRATMTPSMAVDLARIIRTAADRADA